MTDRPDTFVGIDMAGPQTRCVVSLADGESVKYLGHGTMPQSSWNSNEDWDEAQMTSDAVIRAICEAEEIAGLKIVSTVVGVGGTRVRSSLLRSAVPLRRRHEGVTLEDVGVAVRKCAERVRDERSISLQLLPQRFVAGSAGVVRNPLGARAETLEAYVRVISSCRDEHDKARKLVNRSGVSVAETVLGGFAAAYATLLDNECAAGVAHLDIGKSASTLTAYSGGELHLARGIPVGRDHMVDNVSRAFVTEPAVASALIADFGTFRRGEELTVTNVVVPDSESPHGEKVWREWPRSTLDRIMGSSLSACLKLARDEICHKGLMRGGVRSLVVTGDVAVLPGVREMAQSIVGLRTRIGVPTVPCGLPDELRSPAWACAAGLVLYGHRLAYSPPDVRRNRNVAAMRPKEEAA